MASLTSRLRFCRDHSLPAAHACCIAAHLSEAEAAEVIAGLVDEIGLSAEGSGLRIEPDIELGRLAPQGGDDGSSSDDDDSDDRSTVWIGSSGWLQRAIMPTLRVLPDRRVAAVVNRQVSPPRLLLWVASPRWLWDSMHGGSCINTSHTSPYLSYLL